MLSPGKGFVNTDTRVFLVSLTVLLEKQSMESPAVSSKMDD